MPKSMRPSRIKDYGPAETTKGGKRSSLHMVWSLASEEVSC